MHIRVKGLLLSTKSDELVFRIQRVGALTGMYVDVGLCVSSRIGFGVGWGVLTHNSVCHSYLNEERRKWDIHKGLWKLKNVNPFSWQLRCVSAGKSRKYK